MIVTYRLFSRDGYIPDEHRSYNEGKVKWIKTPTPKARPAHYASECDWMVPNLVNPYAVH